MKLVYLVVARLMQLFAEHNIQDYTMRMKEQDDEEYWNK